MLQHQLSGDFTVVNVARRNVQYALPVAYMNASAPPLAPDSILLVGVTDHREVRCFTLVNPLDSGGYLEVPPDPQHGYPHAAVAQIPVMRAAEATFVISVPGDPLITKVLVFNLTWQNDSEGKTTWRLDPLGEVALPRQLPLPDNGSRTATKISTGTQLAPVSHDSVAMPLAQPTNRPTPEQIQEQTREHLLHSRLYQRSVDTGSDVADTVPLDTSEIYPDLASLAKASSQVDLVSITARQSALSPDGERAITNYRIQYIISYKGAPATQAFNVPIGTMLVAGHHAFTRTNGFVFPRMGARYVLFLKSLDGVYRQQMRGPRLAGAGGLQGCFELLDTGRVQPCLILGVVPTTAKYSGMNIEEFLKDVEAAVGASGWRIGTRPSGKPYTPGALPNVHVGPR